MFSFNKKASKIFCIGLNKTGTTSLAKALGDLGYEVANQKESELLLKDYRRRDFTHIIKFCSKYDVFQDIPFGTQFLYPVLDQYFVGARFVLTIRDNAEQWYNSILTFHKLHFNTLVAPTVSDLKNSQYGYPGWFWDLFEDVFHANETPYEEHNMIRVYDDHLRAVQSYFRFKRNLLVINLRDKESYFKLCKFINREPLYDNFPHITSRDIRSGNLDLKFLK